MRFCAESALIARHTWLITEVNLWECWVSTRSARGGSYPPRYNRSLAFDGVKAYSSSMRKKLGIGLIVFSLLAGGLLYDRGLLHPQRPPSRIPSQAAKSDASESSMTTLIGRRARTTLASDRASQSPPTGRIALHFTWEHRVDKS